MKSENPHNIGFNVSSDEKQEHICNVYQNGSLGSQMHKIVEKRVFDKKKTLLKVQNGIMHAIYLTFSRRVSFHDISVISQHKMIFFLNCIIYRWFEEEFNLKAKLGKSCIYFMDFNVSFSFEKISVNLMLIKLKHFSS